MNGNKLTVSYHGRDVGELAEANGHRIGFAYLPSWLEEGFPISPFSLPLKPGPFIPAGMNFGGLWGVFGASLPDSWGRLLMDRMLEKHGKNPSTYSQLDRLAVIGESGMGALCYRPAENYQWESETGDLDELAAECRAILNREAGGDPDRMFTLAGSSGGARPKVMTEEWIIKFPVTGDREDVGLMEKEYMECAGRCGIDVPETKLLPSKKCAGYFAVRRFDREKTEDGTFLRRHMLTVAALLELDWRVPGMDYHTLMKLTKILCPGEKEAAEQLFRRMCFNVYAHNRDDHSKNFSFLYDDRTDRWSLSPAYDLTWSDTAWGEHTTTVNGNGKDPGENDLLAVGKAAGLARTKCLRIAGEIREETNTLLAKVKRPV